MSDVTPLYIYQVGIHHILPPVIGYPVCPPGDFGQVLQPPLVVNADVAVTPFVSVQLADVILKFREVVPVVAIARDGRGLFQS